VVVEALLTPSGLLWSPPGGDRPDTRNPTGWTLRNDPYRELRPVLQELVSRDTARYTGLHAYSDNQAWNVDARALFGHQAISMYPPFAEASRRVAIGHPYTLWFLRLPRFLQNMNVGFLVVDGHTPAERYPPWYDADTFLQVEEEVRALRLLRSTPRFEIREIPSPMPFVYAQDRIEIVPHEAQLGLLVNQDLRRAVFLDERLASTLPSLLPFEEGDEEVSHRFAALQSRNRVRHVDASRWNELRVDVEFARPAMLVIAQAAVPGWHAKVDGRNVPLLDVNFLQQGVWLESGRHVVDLRFRPSVVWVGVAASAGSLLVVALVVAGARRRGTRISEEERDSPRG